MVWDHKLLLFPLCNDNKISLTLKNVEECWTVNSTSSNHKLLLFPLCNDNKISLTLKKGFLKRLIKKIKLLFEFLPDSNRYKSIPKKKLDLNV